MNNSKSFSDKMANFLKKANEVSKKVASNILNKSLSFSDNFNSRENSFDCEPKIVKSSTKNQNIESPDIIVRFSFIFDSLNP